MESINETLELALQFLSILQASCDEKRSSIEQCNQQRYELFVKERKAEQKKAEKLKKELILCQESEKSVLASALNEDLELLSLADSVLEKARAIRSKSKSLPRSEAAPENSLLPKSNIDVNKSSMVSTQSVSSKNSRKDTRNMFNTLPLSKSVPNSLTKRNTTKLHSKSLNDFKVKKEETVPKNGHAVKKSSNSQISQLLKCKTLDSEVGVVTRKNLNELKVLSLNHKCQDDHHRSYKLKNICRENDNKVKTNCGHSTSGSPQNVHQSAISYHFYKSEIRRSLKLKTDFQLSNKEFWYTFMNLENRKCFVKWAHCNTYESFVQIVKLMYEIQELMMWIDLFNLIGKEIMPCLTNLDDKDKNTVRLCSYLSSIYHESLQRIPMLCFD